MSRLVQFDQLPVCFQPNVVSRRDFTQYELPEGKDLDVLLAMGVADAANGFESHWTSTPAERSSYVSPPTLRRGSISRLAAQGVPVTIGHSSNVPITMNVVAGIRWRMNAQLTGKEDVFAIAALGLYPVKDPYIMSAFLALCSKRQGCGVQNKTAIYMASVGAWGGLKTYSYRVSKFQHQADEIDLANGKGIGTDDRDQLFYKWMIALGRDNAISRSAGGVLRAILPKSKRRAPAIEDLDILFVHPAMNRGLRTTLDRYEASRIKRNGGKPQALFNVEV